MKKLSNSINRGILVLIKGIRPFLGPAECRFSVSCTRYAQIQLQKHHTLQACWNITKRVLSCNPFH